jgi:hypothetical protein
MGPIACPETSVTTSERWVTPEKSEYLTHATAQLSSWSQEEQNLASGIRMAMDMSKRHLLRGDLSCDTVYTCRFVTVFWRHVLS